MKKINLLFIFLSSLTSCNKESQVSNVSTTSYIVIEQSTNKILEGNNYDVQRSVPLFLK